MLAKLFEDKVQQYPERVAVQLDTQQMTYTQLNQTANRVARTLLPGNTSGQTVALLFEHGVGMIVGLLGALKAGLIYVPLDPSYPEKRLHYMVEHSEAGIILTNQQNLALAERITEGSTRQVQIISLDQVPLAASPENLNLEIAADQIAYLLYTSGSTGNPKGVIQSHENIWYFIQRYCEMLRLTPADHLTLFSSFSHDAAVMDIYSALLTGAVLYPVNLKNQVNLGEVASWLVRERITIWHSVPTVYRFFLKTLHGDEVFPELRCIVLGGEGVLEYDVAQAGQHFPGTVLINLYGQSESSFNSFQWIDATTPFRKVTLGEVVKGTELLVMTEEGDEALPLEEGEILVVSKHVAVGYWKEEDKTAEVFLEHPELGRMYRTGDLGKLLVNGSIEYLGRKDFQVKIRGYRVEPGEVESRLLQHPAIREAVVVAKAGSGGDYYLVAFVVKRENVGESALREFLSEHLPDYMIPTTFCELPQIPLTPNNKVDRKALLQLELEPAATSEYIPPASETEITLVAIWEEVLGRTQIGVQDNFFSTGGNSLLATQLIAKIYRDFKVELPLREVFQHVTVREQAVRIGEIEKGNYIAIPVAERLDDYPVSSAQKRLYILHRLEPDSLNYNMPKVLVLAGDVDEGRFTDAFRQIVARHESLRTSFHTVDGTIRQVVHPEVPFAVEFIAAKENEIPDRVAGFIRPFDLRQAPLLRVEVLKTVDRAIILCDLHHIAADGTSITILFDEFCRLYAGEVLPELRIQYKDYAIWHNSLSGSEHWRKQEEYWLQTFAGELPVLELPTDWPRPVERSYQGSQLRFALADGAGVLNLARQAGVTPYMLLLAAYNVLLARYTGQEEIIVGTPAAGRPHPDVERLIGMFVNTLALRNWPAGDKTFRAFLGEVRDGAIAAFENQSYPFELLVEQLAVRRDVSRNPLFDTMFMLQNLPGTGAGDLRLVPYQLPVQAVKFDLELGALVVDDGIQFTLNYRTDLFKSQTMEQLAAHFLRILAEIVRDPGQQLAAIDLLSPAEKQRLIAEFSSGKPIELGELTVYQHFTGNAQTYPERVAISCAGIEWSYREVDARAAQLATILRRVGLPKEGLVGLYFERSPWMVVSILAVWMAGGAYIPLDTSFPSGRVAGILADAGAQLLLTSGSDLAAEIRDRFTGTILDLEQLVDQISGECEADRTTGGKLSDLAYVIYTSGSTGKPKGVMVEHWGMLNHMQAKINDLQLDKGSRIAQTASHCFDISLWQFFAALLVGGRTVLVPTETLLNPAGLAQLLEAEGVTVLEVVPSYLTLLLDSLQMYFRPLPELQYLIVTGEAVQPELVRRWFTLYPAKRVVNAYGPTEAADRVTHHIMEWAPVGQSVPIGKPVQNTRLYIVDKHMGLCPVGVRGEICIAGRGIGRGYLHDPERTAGVFGSDPFNPVSGVRLYRTGDIGRWHADGVLEYLGRQDQQVKIRGFRIELGEIEGRLTAHPLVRAAVVVDRQDTAANKYLCAYVVWAQTEQSGIREEANPLAVLKVDLAKLLPEYMVPTQFIVLEQLPLNSNGKVDRKALAAVESSLPSSGEVEEAPSTPTEQELAAIWRELLGVEQIGRHQPFFALGGHSLKVIALFSRIVKKYGVQLSLKEFFKDPTLCSLGRMLGNADQSKAGVTVIDEPYVEFNSGGTHKIFCFPPGRGFGLAYIHLAGYLQEYALYAFNFLEKPDRLDRYIQLIAEAAPEGPLSLVGYSAGGALACEVAKELTQNGRQVAQLILLDAPKVNPVYATTGERQDAAGSVLQYLEAEAEYAAWLHIDGVREKIRAKVESYLKYSHEVVVEGKLPADIHFIKAGDEPAQDAALYGGELNPDEELAVAAVESRITAVIPDAWRTSTSKRFIIHQGAGMHGLMLNRGYAEKNGELIRQILQQDSNGAG